VEVWEGLMGDQPNMATSRNSLGIRHSLPEILRTGN
jgi:hypothetical protein